MHSEMQFYMKTLVFTQTNTHTHTYTAFTPQPNHPIWRKLKEVAEEEEFQIEDQQRLAHIICRFLPSAELQVCMDMAVPMCILTAHTLQEKDDQKSDELDAVVDLVSKLIFFSKKNSKKRGEIITPW
jgi:hypothetical protein